MLILGCPVEDIERKEATAAISKLNYDRNHQMVSFKNSIQGLNLNLSRNYNQGILCEQSK